MINTIFNTMDKCFIKYTLVWRQDNYKALECNICINTFKKGLTPHQLTMNNGQLTIELRFFNEH
jgi:hypothetical protein